MRCVITVGTKAGPQAKLRAIVRGDLALHHALRNDGEICDDWAITYVLTGQQIIVVRGARAGRVALRQFSALSFATIDAALMRRCNQVVSRLRKHNHTVLFPSHRFVSINKV